MVRVTYLSNFPVPSAVSVSAGYGAAVQNGRRAMSREHEINAFIDRHLIDCSVGLSMGSEFDEIVDVVHNPDSVLNELLQKFTNNEVLYEKVGEDGPAHRMMYTMRGTLAGNIKDGTAHSIKRAKKIAALRLTAHPKSQPRANIHSTQLEIIIYSVLYCFLCLLLLTHMI